MAPVLPANSRLLVSDPAGAMSWVPSDPVTQLFTDAWHRWNKTNSEGLHGRVHLEGQINALKPLIDSRLTVDSFNNYTDLANQIHQSKGACQTIGRQWIGRRGAVEARQIQSGNWGHVSCGCSVASELDVNGKEAYTLHYRPLGGCRKSHMGVLNLPNFPLLYPRTSSSSTR